MRDDFGLDRRRFLSWTSASAVALICAHPGVASKSLALASSAEANQRFPRILNLELQSSASMPEMKHFYHGLLGMEIVEDEPTKATFRAGETGLTFVPSVEKDERPFYHFAFNIPENKILSALAWQKARTPILPIPERNRAQNYPPEIVDFPHWNAHSVFFLDPAGNVVEYIARHDLNNSASGSFDISDILYASEIGIIVDDVPTTATKLKQIVGTGQYRGGDAEFTALGDEYGLLLIMRRGRILNFNHSTNDKAARVFQTAVSVRGDNRNTYLFPDFPYQISVDAK